MQIQVMAQAVGSLYRYQEEGGKQQHYLTVLTLNLFKMLHCFIAKGRVGVGVAWYLNNMCGIKELEQIS